MKSGVQPSGRGRERTVLVAGLLSGAALLVAAFATTGDADAAGEVAVTRVAASVADSVRDEWGRLRRDSGDPAEPASDRFRWSSERSTESPMRGPELHDLRPAATEAPDVFLTLLSEAERLERTGGDAGESLELTLEALENEPDARRRAEGRLRAIQYAVRAGNADALREQWTAVQAELLPGDARGDTSYLLLCALAAAPLLGAGERAAAQSWLAGLWDRGELALPDEHDRVVETPAGFAIQPAANVAALRGRLAALSPDADLERLLARDTERRRARALEEALGALPRPAAGGAWRVDFTPRLAFASRSSAPGESEGFFVRRAALEDALRRRADVPAGFAIDFSGDDSRSGTPVRRRTELAGDAFGFVLRHAHPERLAHAERRRVRLLSGALGLLAVLSAAASFFTFRALRRERTLGELKSEFIAGVSHDLRTPLSSILLLAENLEAGRIKDEAGRSRYYGTIRREADRLRRLVDDVLDFSRLERGERKEIRREEITLGPFFDDLSEELRERAEAAGFDFRWTRSGLPESGCIDAEAVRRAAWNLVDNALKHSGGRTVSVDVHVEDGGLCGVAVADDGRGIPGERRDEVFRPFARLGGNRAGAGSGLGLAIVREVARAHGGSATASDGADGSGSTFKLTLDVRAETTGEEER